MPYLEETWTVPQKECERDICINTFAKHLGMVWKANHDLQYVLDAYSHMMYVCGNMKKAQIGMNALMAGACKEAKGGNMTLK